jgi:Xaa-Pro aminopeptidase
VHDPAKYYEGDQRFRAGDVTTIEPGLYVDSAFIASLPDTPRNRDMRARLAPAFAKYGGIGIRIEDDYLITDQGLEWISRAPREINEVEAMMRETLAGAPKRDAERLDWYKRTSGPQTP